MRVAIQLAVFIVLGVVGCFVGLAFWSRRGEGRPDAQGVRTVCKFAGGSRYVTDAERTAAAQLGSAAFGEGVLQAISLELEGAGIQIVGLDADDYGWGVHARLDGREAYLLVGLTGDEGDVWQLLVLSPSSGGPGPTSLLGPIDRALHSLEGITNIAWHSREDLQCAAPFAEPIDRRDSSI